jgi:hypothetical protein
MAIANNNSSTLREGKRRATRAAAITRANAASSLKKIRFVT